MTAPFRSYLQQLAESTDTVLLLQGPVGDFFTQFAHWLQARGKTVHKFNFNGGDSFFYPPSLPNTLEYLDSLDHFSDFLAAYLREHHIGAVVCFGDTRPYHLLARQVAEAQNIGFWAFEEGYFRPHFVTLEKTGVNDFSPLPRNAAFFSSQFPKLPQQFYEAPPVVPAGFLPVAKRAAQYYIHTHKQRARYPEYIHHRAANLGHYIRLWTLSGLKRLGYWIQDAAVAKRVKQGHYRRFFIVPLQVFNDSQVRVHSDFSSVRSFLLHVLTSFATHAPDDINLIVKHHPMDRGFIDYAQDIRRFIKKHPKLKGRITYVHDVPLPVFLRGGIGMVTLNSTSGLSALIHNMPVKVLGRAHYDMAGLTFQGPLAQFWNNPTPPDAELFHAYRMYHINTTQINGNFYSYINFPDQSKEYDAYE
ncbi:capsule biosynthesis protein [Neisseria animalis]|uniref:Capsule biosynthesis protein n=1 Tax=Neisseria animalis TaxID=492 RepID=A0A5P3MNY2_NEIAN|nr:capsule biosynthesis protein [Neisseria animalis]QEY23263.1 capsule biosynthesis protein [Neisseria animalis]ROW31982.1 capsule biosynthesis protein [Neisseria animalis]VEE08539.1 capsule polysaccharide modification protein [Neisseria animalis]